MSQFPNDPKLSPPPLPRRAVPPPFPKWRVAPRRQLAAIKIALVGLGLTMAAAIFILTLIGMGSTLGTTALRWTMLLAFVPVPFYLMLVLWLDRIEKEPIWLLALAFIWGGTFATCFGGLFNVATASIANEAVAAVGSAPIFEELFKGLFILGIFIWRHKEFDGVLDGVIYASMVGLGFAAVENIEYYGRALVAGPGGGVPDVVATFVMRGVFSPYLHPLCTSMTGIGFGLAASRKKGGSARVLYPIAGYAMAVALHALWNGTAVLTSFGFFLLAYAALFVPIFVGLIVLTRFALKREAEIVQAYLVDDVRAGRLSEYDYAAVSSMAARRADLAAAKASGGSALVRIRRRLHQALTDLALYRHRLNCGALQRCGDTEAELYAALNQLSEQKSA